MKAARQECHLDADQRGMRRGGGGGEWYQGTRCTIIGGRTFP